MLLAECMPVKIMLYLMKQRIKDKKNLYLYKCEPKKYKYSCRFMNHENWRCICVNYNGKLELQIVSEVLRVNSTGSSCVFPSHLLGPWTWVVGQSSG
jgi:hypothetical protein